MNKELKFAEELIDFIYDSPTSYHAVTSVEEILNGCGFIKLDECDKWSLREGERYYVTKNGSALAAFVVGKESPLENGFKIIGAHTDSPTFRIKPNPEMIAESSYLKLNTEVYGGPILNTWFDRLLSIAGRVALRGKSPMEPEIRLINIKRPILIIPNLAIHMNRKINSGFEINKQKDTLPIIALVNEALEKENYLVRLIGEELHVKSSDIIDFDLFLYEFEKGCIMGCKNEFISSSRLDDLSMVHAGITALTNAGASKATNVMICFDNEEVGSRTKQGAASPFLSSILERIVLCFKGEREDYFRALSKSFMISADLAHAVHPNVGEKADPVNRPLINKGPVIKISANQSYTTDSSSFAVYSEICRLAGVPVQSFVNRSDEAGGSTIGPISSTHVNIPSVDMGSPILSMHSIRELGGVLDHTYTAKSFEEFYRI